MVRNNNKCIRLFLVSLPAVDYCCFPPGAGEEVVMNLTSRSRLNRLRSQRLILMIREQLTLIIQHLILITPEHLIRRTQRQLPKNR